MKRLGVLLAFMVLFGTMLASAFYWEAGQEGLTIITGTYSGYADGVGSDEAVGVVINEPFDYARISGKFTRTARAADIIFETDGGELVFGRYDGKWQYVFPATSTADSWTVFCSGLPTTATDVNLTIELSRTDAGTYNVTIIEGDYTCNQELVLSGATTLNTIWIGSTAGASYTVGSEGLIVQSDDGAVKWVISSIGAGEETHKVTFSLKDALTGQPLTGVTVKENGQVLGTVDDGGTLVLAKGQHTLTLEKAGYWSVTKTIDVQSDVSVSVEMYPSSAAFKFEDFPAEIKTYENTIYTLTFTLSPIDNSATYNTYLSISSLQNLIEVQKDGSVVTPESGKYYLGDISGPTQVSIRFKAGAVGTHGFTITLTSHDAIMSKTYTTTKSVTYQVEPLPFSVQMPQEWQVGTNTLRISESSGQSYLVTVVLKDSSGNEVWSDSYAFSPYEAHTFSVDVPSEGQYTLEIQFQGKTAVYDITVNPAITLKTKTLTVEKGGEGTIILHFKNPSSDVQYYMIKVSGGFLPSEINQSISVGPLTEKDVSIAFAVPEELTYDAYELNVAVYQGNATVFQDKVAVSISEGSGFTLFGGGSGGGNTLLYLLAGLIFFGGLVVILRRKKR